MCGIAGIFAYGSSAPPVDAEELDACRDHMAARGPDAFASWRDDSGRTGLAHRRLSIIDLDARSSQPMQDSDGRFVIVFNGEIYNYRELRADLEGAGVTFRTTSDTEVLLKLYRRHGEAMIGMLRGMYAFGIWDADQREVFLARDPYGVKPLYYANDGATFRFASQVKALVAGGGVSLEPSAAGWAGFYLFGSVPEPWTTFEAIRSLPAGSTMRVTTNGASPPRRVSSIGRVFEQYGLGASSRSSSDEAIAEEVRAALLDSVRHHLVSDVPVGAFLSGGVDSGALVGLMRDAGHNDIQTMTLTFAEFAGTANDEAPIAEQVARAYGTRHTARVVSEQEFQNDLPALLAAMDQPTVDGVNTWFIAKAAKELGLKVVVSGLGGDELFGGYPSFRQIPKAVRSLGFLAHAPFVGRTVRRAADLMGLSRFGVSAKAAGIAELGSTYAGAYLLRRGLFMPWELSRVMSADMAKRGLAELDPLAHIDREADATGATGFARIAALESSLYMRNQLLRDTDWTSMAHSLEARVPLVDYHLLQKVARLPLGEPKFAGKKLLRVSPGRPLPEAVWNKPKTGFTTPIGKWISGLSQTASPDHRKASRGEHWSRPWALQVAGSLRDSQQVATRAPHPLMAAGGVP